MTVPNIIKKVVAPGNGSSTVFSFSPMVILSSDHLQVSVVDEDGVKTYLTEGTLPTQYRVQVNRYPGTGSIKYPGIGDERVPSTSTVVIQRIVPLTQYTDLENQGGYLPEVQETAFDKLTMIDQQQQDQLDRSLYFPAEETTDGELPSVEERKGRLLAFDDDGKPIPGNPTGAPSGTFTAAGANAVERSYLTKVRELGISVNDYSTLNAARIAAIGKTLIWPAGTYVPTADITFSGMSMVFDQGAVIKPASGVYVNFDVDGIEAGSYQIFDTSDGGHIRGFFPENINPAWFGEGADTDNTNRFLRDSLSEPPDALLRILSFFQTKGTDDSGETLKHMWRRSIQLTQSGETLVVDDDDEAYPSALNSTSLGLALQFVSKFAMRYPQYINELTPLIQEAAECLMTLQYNNPLLGRDGSFRLAPAAEECSTLGTTACGRGLLMAYRAIGWSPALAAAIRAGDFLKAMNRPNDRWNTLYGETVLPTLEYNSVTVNGFCDKVNGADVIYTSQACWNAAACVFLKELAVDANDTSYSTVADAARDFYAAGILGSDGPWDFFSPYRVTPPDPDGVVSTHVSAAYAINTNLIFFDHGWHALGEYTTSSATLARRVSGTAQAGGTSTITLASGDIYTNSLGTILTTDGVLAGQIITINSGTGSGQTRKIINNVASSKVCTVDRAWATNPDNTSVYVRSVPPMTRGTDGFEYGADALLRTGYANPTLIKSRYDYLASLTNPSFQSADPDGGTILYDGRKVFAGFWRLNYYDINVAFGSAYDNQGCLLLYLKKVLTPDDFWRCLDIAIRSPDVSSQLTLALGSKFANGRATKGIIPPAVTGIAMLDCLDKPFVDV